MSDELRQSYDEFPYLSFPFPQSHPDRLATIGWLFGMEPARVEACRVLEVGCASGGNLLPMASSLPSSEFVGVDFSPVQIERGVADVKALGLTNIQLLAMDIMDFSEAHGQFDYIIAHGVYSWVPNTGAGAASRDLRTPASSGGHRLRQLQHASRMADAQRRPRRDDLSHAGHRGAGEARRASARGPRVPRRIGQGRCVRVRQRAAPEAEYLRKQADYYILHDHLEEVNEPLYFHQFIERAARHGLGYLGEANFATMLGTGFSPKVIETLARVAPDVLKREQFIDFLHARTFRETLLVRSDVALDAQGVPRARDVAARRVEGRARARQAGPRVERDRGIPHARRRWP